MQLPAVKSPPSLQVGFHGASALGAGSSHLYASIHEASFALPHLPTQDWQEYFASRLEDGGDGETKVVLDVAMLDGARALILSVNWL